MRAILVTTVLMALAGSASAQSEEELKPRFRERLAAIQTLKDAGKAGETMDGKLEAITGGVDQKLLAAENADRAALYALIAKRTGETPAAVAQQAAIRNYREAGPEHFLKLKDGKWVQKKSIGAAPAG